MQLQQAIVLHYKPGRIVYASWYSRVERFGDLTAVEPRLLTKTFRNPRAVTSSPYYSGSRPEGSPLCGEFFGSFCLPGETTERILCKKRPVASNRPSPP